MKRGHQTNKQTNTHCDYQTNSAQRAELVKILHIRETESLNQCKQKHRYTKKNIQAFFSKNIFKKIGRGYFRQREKYLAGALALLFGKFWLVNKFLGVKHIFSLLPYILQALCLFSLDVQRNFKQIWESFFISKNIKMYNLDISITLVNKTPTVSQIMGLFLKKAINIQDFLKSFSGKVLIILDFFRITVIF